MDGGVAPRERAIAPETDLDAPRVPWCEDPASMESLLVALAFLLPFEAPLFSLGPLQITTVELVLYATLAAWGWSCARDIAAEPSKLYTQARAALREPLVAAAIVFGFVTIVSALLAPADRAASIKFALRSASGILLFFAVRAGARTPETSGRVLLALVAGAEASGLTALVDWSLPGSTPLWRAFREGSFDVFGLPRASGVFAYPTIGAMYWEATVPLCFVAPWVAPRRGTPGRPARALVITVLLSALLAAAILASATRSGLAGAFVASGFLALSRTLDTRVRRGAAAVVGVLALSAGLAFWITGQDSVLGQRLRWWRDEQWFRVEYTVAPPPGSIAVGEHFKVPVTLRNVGALTWPRAGERPVHLASHWEPIDRPSRRADFEGARTELPANVPPGGAVTLNGTVWAPSLPGLYRLHWDLVQEHTTWFSERGSPMPSQPVVVEGLPSGAAQPVPEAPFFPTLVPPPSRPRLWGAAVVLWRAHPLLGIGPDNFRRAYEDVLSPGLGGQRYEDRRLHANSLYFETLADLGLAGVGALAAVALGLVRRARSHFRAGRLAGVGFGVAAGTFFVHGLLDYFFEFTPLFGLFWLLLGLTEAAEHELPTRENQSTRT